MAGGISFALGALLCAALNDIVFKKAAAANISIGWFASTIGTTWGIVQVCGLGVFMPSLLSDWSEPTKLYGPWVALILAAANLLMIEALVGIPASAGSTVYRLNSVGVVLGGWMLLGEPLTALKMGGVTSGVIAVLLMYLAGARAAAPPGGYRPTGARDVGETKTPLREEGEEADEELQTLPPPSPGSGGAARSTGYYYMLAVVASTLRAAYGVISKRALQSGANSTQLVLCGAMGWAVVGAAWGLLREGNPWGWRNPTVLRYGTINGMLQMANIGLLNLALMQGSASIVVPVANCSFAMTLTISVLCGMESVDKFKAAAIGMAVVCIGLLARAAMEAAAQDAEGGHNHRHGGRGLAELLMGGGDGDAGEAAAEGSWQEGAWLLAPALLQMI